MSRLIVKNLPKNISTEKLCEVFSEKGLVTDVQLKYTKDGKFRHFGFVGFKTEQEARDALEYFNNTCIKASKISVEFCAGLGDPNKPQAWSKYALDSSAYNKENGELKEKKNQERQQRKKEKKKDNVVQELLDKHKNDPLFLEFMETHARNNKVLWSNDIALNTNSTGIEPEPQLPHNHELDSHNDSDHDSDASIMSDEEGKEPEDNVAKEKISNREYLRLKTSKEAERKQQSENEIGKKKSEAKLDPSVQFFTVKVRGLAYKAKKRDIKQFFHPLKPKSIRLPPKNKGIAYIGFKTEKEMRQALKKHLSFLAGKRLWVTKYLKRECTPDLEVNRGDNRWKDQEESLKNEETIAESGRIFVRNLAYTTSEDDVEQLFSKYGPVTEVAMPVDRQTRKTKGYAVITYLVPENATKAYMELDGSIFHGRMLHLIPGKAKQSLEDLIEKEGLTFKQKQLLKKKAEAASSHNWNTLFLGQNAVADLIAELYNTSKDKVLDSSGKESIAVRLALGETQIVSQMQEFLKDSGVHLDAFNQAPKQRSKTIILAKNLPAKTLELEIRQMFMKHGELGRVILPPSGVTAIVEFLEPSEAKTAFTKLAYTKFKHLPLYLEWAPSDTFITPSKPNPQVRNKKLENNGGNDDNSSKEDVSALPHVNSSESSEDEDEPPEAETTLFVKNLNFTTDKEEIKEHFKKCGPIHEISVAKKKDPKNPGKLLSMGYGFIQFKKKASADKALKTLQQSVLDEHAIELKRSQRTFNRNEVTTVRKKTKIGKQTGTKILVRNIPFQATRKEVLDLFRTFGELKALRLPKKMVGTGSHRGFAFIDYYTKHDAKRAFKALCQSTHLYGRRLVLEWAATEEKIDDLRKRTAENFSEGPLNKTLKKSTASHDIEEDSN